MFNSTKNKPEVCSQLKMCYAEKQIATKSIIDGLFTSVQPDSGFCLKHFLSNINKQHSSYLQLKSRRVNDSFKLNTQLP